MSTQVYPSVAGASAGTTVTGMFGNGGDGVLSVVGTYTATTERQWQTLTIPSGGVYKPAGYRTYVKGTCTIDANGSYNDNGTAGSAGGTGWTARWWLGGAAGTGGAGRNTTGSGNPGGGSGGASSPNDTGAAPTGGAGGQGSGAYLGGAGGGAAAPNPVVRAAGHWYQGRYGASAFNGGAGGGGGGCIVNTDSPVSGRGGGGAGIVWLAAATLANSGTISADGGAGDNASGTATLGGAGGGGGGGGGIVWVITNTPTGQCGVITANGGAGGTGIGSGTAGTTGTAGTVCLVSFGG